MIIVFVVIAGFITYYLVMKNQPAQIETDGFDLLSVSEQVNILKQKTDALSAIEDLLTDIACCTPDCQICIQISWTNLEGKSSTHSVYLDGLSFQTEKVSELFEREAADLRTDIAISTALMKSGAPVIQRRRR